MTQSSDPIVVWGVGTTRTFRVHWMLHELGVDYQTQRIESRTGETKQSAFTAINPKQKIPTLVHGNLELSESYAIMRYARATFGGLPYDDFQLSAEGQARFDEWVTFILMELDATSLYVIRRHKDLPHIYGHAPEAVKSSGEYFKRMLDAITTQIHPDKPLWGSRFSEVDILFTIVLDWAGLLEIRMPDAVMAYRAAMHERSAYQTAFKHNFRDLSLNTLSQ